MHSTLFGISLSLGHRPSATGEICIHRCVFALDDFCPRYAACAFFISRLNAPANELRAHYRVHRIQISLSLSRRGEL